MAGFIKGDVVVLNGQKTRSAGEAQMTQQEQTITSVMHYYQQKWKEWSLQHPDAPSYNQEQYTRLLASSKEANHCQSWNQWRKDHYDVLINLRGADLSGVDLSGADLNRADMRGTNLTHAKLEGANFDGTFLEFVLMDDKTALSHPTFTRTLAEIWRASGKPFPMKLAVRLVFNRIA